MNITRFLLVMGGLLVTVNADIKLHEAFYVTGDTISIKNSSPENMKKVEKELRLTYNPTPVEVTGSKIKLNGGKKCFLFMPKNYIKTYYRFTWSGECKMQDKYTYLAEGYGKLSLAGARYEYRYFEGVMNQGVFNGHVIEINQYRYERFAEVHNYIFNGGYPIEMKRGTDTNREQLNRVIATKNRQKPVQYSKSQKPSIDKGAVLFGLGLAAIAGVVMSENDSPSSSSSSSSYSSSTSSYDARCYSRCKSNRNNVEASCQGLSREYIDLLSTSTYYSACMRKAKSAYKDCEYSCR